jgi:hypothetical protein
MKSTAETDPNFYLPLLQEHWDELVALYMQFAEHSPVMEYDIEEGQLRAWPAEAYLDGLTERTREDTKQLYKRVTASGKMMVFVRDAERRILRSYTFALFEVHEPSKPPKRKTKRKTKRSLPSKASARGKPPGRKG